MKEENQTNNEELEKLMKENQELEEKPKHQSAHGKI